MRRELALAAETNYAFDRRPVVRYDEAVEMTNLSNARKPRRQGCSRPVRDRILHQPPCWSMQGPHPPGQPSSPKSD